MVSCVVTMTTHYTPPYHLRCHVSSWYPGQPNPVRRIQPHPSQLCPRLVGIVTVSWSDLLHIPSPSPLHVGPMYLPHREESVQHSPQHPCSVGLPPSTLHLTTCHFDMHDYHITSHHISVVSTNLGLGEKCRHMHAHAHFPTQYEAINYYRVEIAEIEVSPSLPHWVEPCTCRYTKHCTRPRGGGGGV